MSRMGRTAEATLRFNPLGEPAAANSRERRAPAVLAMSRLIELMELAAARLMRQKLAPGECSVAVCTRLRHAAFASIHGDLRALANYRRTAGRLHHFDVHVFDEKGLVASSEHVRAVAVGRHLETTAGRGADGLRG